jgi:hypothetical protein
MKTWLVIVLVSISIFIVVAVALVLSAMYPPIKGREFVVGEHDGGFFSRVIGMAAGAHYGEHNGASRIVLTNSDYRNQYTDKSHNLMEVYFEQSEFTIDDTYKPQPAIQRFITRIDPIVVGKSKAIPSRRRFSKHFWGPHRQVFPAKSNIPLREMADAVEKYIHFRNDIVDKADDWYWNNVNPGPLSYVVCIHYRGTDTSLHYPFHKSDPELYWNKMQELIDEHHDVRLFIATDEKSFALESTKRFPNCYMYDSPRSDTNIGLHFEGGHDPWELGESVIIDALLLSKGNHLIKGRSNVSEYSLFANPDAACTIIYNKEHQWYKGDGRDTIFVNHSL